MKSHLSILTAAVLVLLSAPLLHTTEATTSHSTNGCIPGCECARIPQNRYDRLGGRGLEVKCSGRELKAVPDISKLQQATGFPLNLDFIIL